MLVQLIDGPFRISDSIAEYLQYFLRILLYQKLIFSLEGKFLIALMKVRI